VYAIESVGHLADTAQLITALSGYATAIKLVHKDARFVTATSPGAPGGGGAGRGGGGAPLLGDAPPPELPLRAHLAVFELFDCGTIGEGVLHVLAAAKAQLLATGAEVVPARASVRCQPGQLRRLGRLAPRGLDLAPLNQYHWLPDYQEVDLASALATGQWLPAAEPQLLFEFDFRGGDEQLAQAFQPAEALLQFEAAPEAPGVVNCVAFWLELDLGGGEVLSCAPNGGACGSTWQQAVQFVEEVWVGPGGALAVRGRHDTYSIDFQLADPPAGSAGAGGCSGGAQLAPTGVPLFEPSWQAQYEELARVGAELGRACAADPLRRRQLAALALQLSSRPGEHGVDPAQAAAFCVRMMS
jgi:hypothetical protein